MRYNVLAGVVETIDADSPAQAQRILDERLIAAGFQPHSLTEAFGAEPDVLAFEDENQD